ncbi:MAG: elongation factor P [Acidobacteriota bacterium]
MLPASEIKRGMVLREGSHLLQVLHSEFHMGGGQMGGLQHVKVRNLSTGSTFERRFKPDEKVDVVDVDRRHLEYLYSEGDTYVFMDRETFEQFPIPAHLVGDKAVYLSPDLDVVGLFLEGNPISVQFPETVDLKVVSAPPPLHEQDSNTPKTVQLENGMEILAPQFIKEGDVVRVEIETGKYLERL